MPEIINPFDENGYDVATMTQAINILPNRYGRIRELNLFSLDPVRTRTIIFEEINGLLTLLQSQPTGAPAPKKKHGKAKMRSFVIPRIPYDDVILPGDIQGLRQPGTVDLKTLEIVMMGRLEEMRAAHAVTEEHLMAGAIKGIILDADGAVLHNLYTEFGVAQKSITFALSNTSTDVNAKCRAVVRHMEDNLLGDVMSGVRCLCGQDFFDALIGHPKVEQFFVNYKEGLERISSGADPRKGFPFGGITFEEYRGKAPDPTTGSMRQFIADEGAHFFPEGTQTTFKLHHAPADWMETVNSFGQPIYAKQILHAKGTHVDVMTESKPLPLCRRPGVLVTGIIN